MTIKASSYPTSRPTLDLNFAQTKRLDPRVTFTRSSTGTYFDANGVLQSAATNTARFDHNPATGESLGLLVEEARTNQIIASNIGFSENNVQRFAGVAPDGTFTAALLTNDNSSAGNYTSPGAGTFTYSIYVKQGTSSTFRLIYAGYGYTDWVFTFSTESFVVSTVAGWTNASVQKLPNGWYRLSATHGNRPLYYYGFSTDSATSTVYFWGHQREAGSFPTSYIPTPATFTSRASSATYYDASGVIQTAGTNVARSAAFFPDSNGVMRPAGLLLEAAGTNLIISSQVFNSGGWNLDGASLTANAAVAPDGTTTATSIVQGTGGNRTYHFDNNGSGSKTFTIFAKSNAGSSFVVGGNMSYGTNSAATATLNTADGTISGATGCSSIKLANGWYRFILPVFVSAGSSNTNYFAINGPASSVYIWGAQLEASPYPTSYIATTTATVTRSADVSSSATVTRSADVASITGTNFSSWFNQTSGTFYTETSATSYQQALWRFQNSTRWYALGSTANFYSELYDFAGGGGAVTAANGQASSSKFKMAATVDNTSLIHKACMNGGVVTPSSYDYQYNHIQLTIGFIADFPLYMNSRLSRLTYWPTRLSDATLQAITL